MTVADIRSVSPEAWTTWKGDLLERLYRNTADWLEAELPDETAPQYLFEQAVGRAGEVQQELLRSLAESGTPLERAEAFLEGLPKRYLLHHRIQEMAVHVRAALAYLDSGKRAGVHLHHPEGRGASSCELVVFAGDRLGLFATVSGLLAAARWNILNAHVYTTREGLAMEIYRVPPIAGGADEEETERSKLERRLLDVIEGRQSVEALIVARPPSAAPPVRFQAPAVRVSNEDSDFYSIVDVAAQDRPGLLYDITRTLAEIGLNVVISRASTRASRVSDAFYVTEDGHKILDPSRKREIQRALLAAVEPDPA
jgi:[protein-PII] uridylyltransferase